MTGQLIDPYRFATAAPFDPAALTTAMLATSPAALWPLNDANLTADDAVGSRNLTHSTLPTTDPIFGKSAVGRVTGSGISALAVKAVAGWFYFPSTVTRDTAFVGLIGSQNGSNVLAIGGNITGAIANEILSLTGVLGSAWGRAFDSAAGSIAAGWHFIDATYRTSLSRWMLHVDGVDVSNFQYEGGGGSPPSSFNSGTGNLYLGTYDGSVGHLAAGMKMSHLGMWTTELSDANIAAILDAGPDL